MLGQGSGLNSKLRKLLARVQREFQYPRVTLVKCHIHAATRKWQDDTEVVLNRVPPPPVTLNPVPLGVEGELKQEALKTAVCHRMVPMEEMTAETHKVDCWQRDTIPLNRPDAHIVPPRCSPFPTRIAPPQTHSPSFRLQSFKIHHPAFQPKAVVRRNVALAETLPMRLVIQPFGKMSMKMQIRYRTSVLSSLGLKPRQVGFTGVVRGLPPIPLRLLDVETGGVGGDVALARIVGPANPMLGRRVWVIINHKEKNRFIPITLKEE